MTPPPLSADSALTGEMLARFAERAPLYDRERRFFTEDFLELRASGYLDLALPTEHGGAGLSLAEIGTQQRRLAYHAPATALGVSGHLLWTGLAAELANAGDHGCAWILERAAAGEVFAAGHGVADVPPFRSTTRAERVDGGWELTGQQVACGLAPVRDWLGVHATDTADPRHPRVVHAFLPRDAGGCRVRPARDTRATGSDDIRLDRAYVRDEHVAHVGPTGLAGAAAFPVAVLAWAVLGYADAHTGIAQRVFDLAVAGTRAGTIAHRPAIRRRIAEMGLAVEAGRMVVDRVDADWSAGVDHGAGWPLKIITARHVAAATARTVADSALALGDATEHVEQLFRDALHPADRASTHELVATLCLGM